ncbi:MAG: hypothetical protein ABI597_06060 [Gammaproteobacteria bacterium]
MKARKQPSLVLSTLVATKHYQFAQKYVGLAKQFPEMLIDKLDIALVFIEKAISLNESTPDYYYLRGEIYFLQGHHQRAQADFKACFEQKSHQKTTVVFWNIIRTLLHNDHFNDARNYLSCMPKYAKDAAGLADEKLISLYMQEGVNSLGAIENQLTLAIKRQPTARLYIFRAAVYTKQNLNREQLANADMKIALKLLEGDKDKCELLYKSILLDIRTDSPEPREIEEGKPDLSPKLKKINASMRRGLAAFSGEQWQSAIDYFTTAIKEQPEHFDWLYLKSWEELAKGEFLRAHCILESVCKTLPLNSADFLDAVILRDLLNVLLGVKQAGKHFQSHLSINIVDTSSVLLVMPDAPSEYIFADTFNKFMAEKRLEIKASSAWFSFYDADYIFNNLSDFALRNPSLSRNFALYFAGCNFLSERNIAQAKESFALALLPLMQTADAEFNEAIRQLTLFRLGLIDAIYKDFDSAIAKFEELICANEEKHSVKDFTTGLNPYLALLMVYAEQEKNLVKYEKELNANFIALNVNLNGNQEDKKEIIDSYHANKSVILDERATNFAQRKEILHKMWKIRNVNIVMRFKFGMEALDLEKKLGSSPIEEKADNPTLNSLLKLFLSKDMSDADRNSLAPSLFEKLMDPHFELLTKSSGGKFKLQEKLTLAEKTLLLCALLNGVEQGQKNQVLQYGYTKPGSFLYDCLVNTTDISFLNGNSLKLIRETLKKHYTPIGLEASRDLSRKYLL